MGRRIRQKGDGFEARHPPEDLLDDPRTMKPQTFRAAKEVTETRRLDASADEGLRNGDTSLDSRAHDAEGTTRTTVYSYRALTPLTEVRS